MTNIVGVDRKGAIHEGRDDLNVAKLWFAEHTNPEQRQRHPRPRCCPAPTCSSACAGPDLITADDLRKMAARPDRVRHGQPRPRDPARGMPTAWPPSSPPAAATTRTRSTTCWPSPASSGARSTPAPRTITEDMKLAAATAIAAGVSRRRAARPTTSSRRCSTRRVGRAGRRGRRRGRGADGVCRGAARRLDPMVGAPPPKAVTFDFWNTLVARTPAPATAASTPGSALLDGRGLRPRAASGCTRRSASHGARSSTRLATATGVYGATDAVDDIARARSGSTPRRPCAPRWSRSITDPSTRRTTRSPTAAHRRRLAALRSAGHPHRHHLRRRAWRRRPTLRRFLDAPRPARLLRPLVVLRRGRHVQARPGDLRTTPSTASVASTRRDAAHVGDLRRTDIAGAQALGHHRRPLHGGLRRPGQRRRRHGRGRGRRRARRPRRPGYRARALTGPLAGQQARLPPVVAEIVRALSLLPRPVGRSMGA